MLIIFSCKFSYILLDEMSSHHLPIVLCVHCFLSLKCDSPDISPSPDKRPTKKSFFVPSCSSSLPESLNILTNSNSQFFPFLNHNFSVQSKKCLSVIIQDFSQIVCTESITILHLIQLCLIYDRVTFWEKHWGISSLWKYQKLYYISLDGTASGIHPNCSF